jgi:hypothetical protein
MRPSFFFTLPLLLTLACSGPEQGITPPQGPGNDPAGGGAADADGGGGGGAPPAFGRVDPPGFILGDDEGVELSGNLSYIDEVEPVGSLRLEVMAVVGEAETTLLAVQDLEELVDWKMRVPKDLGEITILAYFDAEMNGPSPGEPLGQLFENLVIGSESIGGIDLVLSAKEPGPPPTGDEHGAEVPPPADGPVHPGDKGDDPGRPGVDGPAASGPAEAAEPEPEPAPAEPAPAEAAPAEAAPAEAAPAEAAPAEAAPAE